MWQDLWLGIVEDIAAVQHLAVRRISAEAQASAMEARQMAYKLSAWQKRQRATVARKMRRCPLLGPQMRADDARRRRRLKVSPARRAKRLATQRECMRRLYAKRHQISAKGDQ